MKSFQGTRQESIEMISFQAAHQEKTEITSFYP